LKAETGIPDQAVRAEPLGMEFGSSKGLRARSSAPRRLISGLLPLQRLD